jgi:hypothetical protein
MSALNICSLIPLGCKPNTKILFKKKNCIEVGVYEPEMIDLPRVTEPVMLKMMIEKKAHQVTKVFVKALNVDFVTVTYRSDPRRLGELFDRAYAVNYGDGICAVDRGTADLLLENPKISPKFSILDDYVTMLTIDPAFAKSFLAVSHSVL